MQTFQITERQMTAFRQDAKRRYVASVVEFLQKNFPEAATEKPETLMAFVSAMVQRAEKYGLDTKREAAFYVIAAHLLGAGFEEKYERAHRVLSSSLPGPEKADLLQKVTIEQLEADERKLA